MALNRYGTLLSFLLFVTFSIGILSLGITMTAALKTRKVFVSSYLFFYLAFSLVIVAEMFLAYIQTNISQSTTMIVLLWESLASIGIYLLIVAVPACTHVLCSSVRLQWRNGIFAALALGVFLISRITNTIDALALEQLESLILLPVILYSFLYGVRCYATIQAPTHKMFAKKWLILLGCACALLGAELLSGGIEKLTLSQNMVFLVIGRGIVLYPIVYCSFSVLFTWHFLKHSLLHAPQPSPEQAAPQNTQSGGGVTIESLCAPYHLSIGGPHGRSMSVKTVPKRIQGPNWRVMS